MTRPVASRDAFAYFGLIIGLLPPLAILLKLLLLSPSDTVGPGILFAGAGVGTGLAGFVIGRRYIPKAVRYASKFSLPNRVALWTLIGIGWGSLSGAFGGLVFAIFGAV